MFLYIPIYETGYEEINIFDWRSEVKSMIFQNEFVKMVSVQSETVSRYINEGKIIPDSVVETGYKNFHFLNENITKKYAKQFNWDIITPVNMMNKFIEMVEKMDMSHSYKPVLLYAMFENADDKVKVLIEDMGFMKRSRDIEYVEFNSHI
ncbi:hypothetical protein J2Z76_000137 [Sedimentibacter acidaminivorans]|uniref:Uncharacterized protein n=1 Tax=Sedimentibacter acidaminivorans TaxID=913099 RepID=A0ABS4G9C8_9FIRM|nr:hypothetical protein [Sedimentibacter acidaminivorans]MBP1924284.1 hypothetical protein [Sedimentibacter acidaminivorans]